MDKVSDPLEAIIEFACANGADLFWVNNARDELKRLRGGYSEPIAWANVNSSGDLFNFSIVYNPYAKNLIPVYVRVLDVERGMNEG